MSFAGHVHVNPKRRKRIAWSLYFLSYDCAGEVANRTRR